MQTSCLQRKYKLDIPFKSFKNRKISIKVAVEYQKVVDIKFILKKAGVNKGVEFE